MSEGNKIGDYQGDNEFNVAVQSTVKEEGSETLKPTKIGEVSEFEKSLYDPVSSEKTEEKVQEPMNSHIIIAVVFAVRKTDSLKLCHLRVL